MVDYSLAGRQNLSARTIIPPLLFCLALIVYLRTLAPSITWKNDAVDSGELVTAAFVGGIPHPTGYPPYTILAAGFARLPFDEPARGVALFSALCAAGAVVLIYFAARAVIAEEDDSVRLSAMAAALTLAFAPLFWAQANVAELYALNALIVAALLAILLSHLPRRLEIAALIFGLGLAHHLTIVLLAPSALLLLREERRTRAQITRAAVLLLAPLLFYLYLPLRAIADPPVNWGNPSTLGRFWWTVSGAPYHAYLFNFPMEQLPARAGSIARIVFQQFGAWGVVLGLWGIARMFQDDAPRARRVWLALALAFALGVAYSLAYSTRNANVYLLPAFLIFALWIAYGIRDLVTFLSPRWARAIVVAALIGMPAFNLAANFSAMDLSRDRAAFDYARTAFRTAPNDALIIADGDAHLFALWYYRYVIAGESRVHIVSRELLRYDWYSDARRGDEAVASSAARAHALIDQSLRDGRAVYVTVYDEWFVAYSAQRQGELFLITGRRP